MSNECSTTPEKSLVRWCFRVVWSVIKYISPWMSFLGIAMALAGLSVWPFFLLLEYLKEPKDPVFSLIALVGPAGMVAVGVGLAVVGLAIQCLAHLEGTGKWFPRMNWRLPVFRRMVVLCVLFGFIAGSIGIYNAVAIVDYTESTEFCAELCHTVMHPEGTTLELGPHADSHCSKCHVGPGIPHYLRMKVIGSYELLSLIFGLYEKPLHISDYSLRSSEVICGQCHSHGADHGQVLDTYTYFKQDDGHTRYDLSLLMNVGSPHADNDLPEGAGNIHWHTSKDHEMFYLATDELEQTIPYVKVVHADGSEQVFTDQEGEVDVDALLAEGHKMRKVDCYTCHNRAAHQVRSPRVTVNEALASGDIDRGLPSIKSKAIEVLTKEYETTEDALAAIEADLMSYYATEHPGVDSGESSSLAKAVAAIQNIYKTSFFPKMKTDWSSNPDNIGHMEFPGCFRCHGGQHADSGGEVISRDCVVCHDVIAQGKDGEEMTVALGQTFQHPEDMGGMEQEMSCTGCHKDPASGMERFLRCSVVIRSAFGAARRSYLSVVGSVGGQ